MKKIITLDEFIIQRQKDFPFSMGELSSLLRYVVVAAKSINQQVRRAGLANILGAAGEANATGDDVQKLDLIADDTFISYLRNSGECCGIASEEQKSFKAFKGNNDAHYIAVFDPLDGSGNIDINASIGTIFAIYRRVSATGEECTIDDFLRKGTEQVAAGYVVYGSSTMLVYTTGNGVNGFTLDEAIGEFCLSHPNIKIPATGKYFSVNQGNYNQFTPQVQTYIQDCISKGYNQRYIGAMIADIHRTLIKGGIFMYPATKKAPNGKLRLLYECNPLAYLVEQAGGKASTGSSRILDIQAEDLHQRTPLFIGSVEMVNLAESILSN